MNILVGEKEQRLRYGEKKEKKWSNATDSHFYNLPKSPTLLKQSLDCYSIADAACNSESLQSSFITAAATEGSTLAVTSPGQ